jgi:hypothetical protein
MACTTLISFTLVIAYVQSFPPLPATMHPSNMDPQFREAQLIALTSHLRGTSKTTAAGVQRTLHQVQVAIGLEFARDTLGMVMTELLPPVQDALSIRRILIGDVLACHHLRLPSQSAGVSVWRWQRSSYRGQEPYRTHGPRALRSITSYFS